MHLHYQADLLENYEWMSAPEHGNLYMATESQAAALSGKTAIFGKLLEAYIAVIWLRPGSSCRAQDPSPSWKSEESISVGRMPAQAQSKPPFYTSDRRGLANLAVSTGSPSGLAVYGDGGGLNAIQMADLLPANKTQGLSLMATHMCSCIPMNIHGGCRCQPSRPTNTAFS